MGVLPPSHWVIGAQEGTLTLHYCLGRLGTSGLFKAALPLLSALSLCLVTSWGFPRVRAHSGPWSRPASGCDAWPQRSPGIGLWGQGAVWVMRKGCCLAPQHMFTYVSPCSTPGWELLGERSLLSLSPRWPPRRDKQRTLGHTKATLCQPRF